MALVVVLRSPAELSQAGEVLGSSRVVVLEPQRWLNQPFPLLSHVEFPADLRQGDWLVVLYRPDCAHCQELLPELTRQFDEIESTPSSLPAAPLDLGESDGRQTATALGLLDLTSQAAVEWQVPRRIASGRLSNAREWFVTTPVTVGLRNGIVHHVVTGFHSIAAAVAATRNTDLTSSNRSRGGLGGGLHP